MKLQFSAYKLHAALFSLLCLLAACGGSEPASDVVDEAADKATEISAAAEIDANNARLVTYTESREACENYTPNRMPLFGDVHVHTNLSFDAAANTIRATPEDAHRYARGEAIAFWPLDEAGNPVGEYKIDRPLDFLAVTDHGEFLGERRLCVQEDSPVYNSEICQVYRTDERQGMMMLSQSITVENPERIPSLCGEDSQLCLDWAKTPWQEAIDAAEQAYDRSSACEFTSFVAYEYTGTPGVSNYHRNVIFRNNKVPERPVSYIDAPYDSALWKGLDAECTSDDGCEYLTIPHNSNLANGRMKPYMRLDPTMENRVAYAKKRLQREPIMEIFQHKGNSECINGLSSVLGAPDELCDIEAVRKIGREEVFDSVAADGATTQLTETRLVTEECGAEVGENGMLGAGCVDASDFHRSSLLVGLAEQRETGLNPAKLGVVAATDTHTASPGSVMEDDWRGHVTGEANPAERLKPGLLTSGIDGNAGGLAGVWAMENSRDAIFEAMLRREVFGTTGTRIVPRFFAGWDLPADLCERSDMAEVGYAQGVPMGGDLMQNDSADAKPMILLSAMADNGPGATQLDKLQLIKGWVDAEGKKHNQVIDVAGGDGANHASLCVVYRDEDFVAGDSVYYYLRAVEHPVKRWHRYDCEALGDKAPEVCSNGSYPDTVRELAWSSPIWYQP
ncbi:MAG: DUF3604 domain-containing protein [Gammaproteobacteria bacterium]|nr:DUF3604 domain-containing protein [Gammaproteobacteria bacterium]